MKRIASLCVSLLIFPMAFAEIAPKSVGEYCAASRQQHYTQEMAKSSTNQLAFRNQGGLINGGVCWWHSRFTRNALYLAIYRPDMPKPTSDQMESIVKEIRRGNNIVTIPGFANLRSFSSDPTARRLIQDELESWQRFDGFIRQQWIVGLSGRRISEAAKLKRSMDELYEYVVLEDNIAYQRLSMPGIVAHAWLVVDVHRLGSGYQLEVVDSNYTGKQTWTYREGMTNFNYGGFGVFTPYTEQKRELRTLKTVAQRFCR
jgi:hypothetical protein